MEEPLVVEQQQEVSSKTKHLTIRLILQIFLRKAIIYQQIFESTTQIFHLESLFVYIHVQSKQTKALKHLALLLNHRIYEGITENFPETLVTLFCVPYFPYSLVNSARSLS